MIRSRRFHPKHTSFTFTYYFYGCFDKKKDEMFDTGIQLTWAVVLLVNCESLFARFCTHTYIYIEHTLRVVAGLYHLINMVRFFLKYEITNKLRVLVSIYCAGYNCSSEERFVFFFFCYKSGLVYGESFLLFTLWEKCVCKLCQLDVNRLGGFIFIRFYLKNICWRMLNQEAEMH